jgi:protein TonB
MASKIDVIAPSKTETDQPLLTPEDATTVITVPQEEPRQMARPAVEDAAVEPPPLPATEGGGSGLGKVLATPSVSAPELSNLAISQGVTAGRLIRRVSPAYPPQALLLRLEGRVILDATIYEDGTVHEISVVQGQPVLARSAKEAVARWRYKPFELNGQPVKTKTTITVDFKLPGDSSIR